MAASIDARLGQKVLICEACAAMDACQAVKPASEMGNILGFQLA
jgi:hypothetical protein